MIKVRATLLTYGNVTDLALTVQTADEDFFKVIPLTREEARSISAQVNQNLKRGGSMRAHTLMVGWIYSAEIFIPYDHEVRVM